MQKSIAVETDKSTWPTSGAPGFPTSFVAGHSTYNIPILATLLLIGQLTTPPLLRGVSLSEFWAYVRYLHAVAKTGEIRISSDFANLDSHQKTILSDDFGMGIPIGYLIPKLNLAEWSDGRYFMDRVSSLIHGPLPVPRKRGPRKAPDFVFADSAGVLHVVECKGGQSGPEARDRQLSSVTSKGVPTGGRVQKRMVLLPANLQGQRLACGVSLAQDGKAGTSSLKIVDPELEVEFDLSKAEGRDLRDPIIRAGMSRSLRMAGLPLAAAAIAAPSGLSPRAGNSDRFGKATRTKKRQFIDARNAAARTELSSRAVATFGLDGASILGREVTMVLPLPIEVGGSFYRRVTIRQGVTADLAQEVLERGFVEEALPKLDSMDDGVISMAAEGASARLRIGKMFVSEIHLEKSDGPGLTDEAVAS